MQSEYVASLRGSPQSDGVASCSRRHFHTSSALSGSLGDRISIVESPAALGSRHTVDGSSSSEQSPSPSQVTQTSLLSPAQGLPAGSKWHVESQQSPLTVLPSSQSSSSSTLPSPHTPQSATQLAKSSPLPPKSRRQSSMHVALAT